MIQEKLIDKSCTDFAAALASSAATPGGGGAAALVGALGVALGSMAGNLTLGRKKYAAAEPDIRRLLAQGEDVRHMLLRLIDEDATAFAPLSRAYAIPKDTPGRAALLEQATLDALAPPLESMRWCCRAIDLLAEMAEKGSTMLISDVGCGALCCCAALECASLNVFVNTKTLQNRERAEQLEAEADEMLASYCALARRTADQITCQLRGRDCK
ncbi:MAG: cyclodeaminase/cyclohydrolase family protein [Oscillospiraceae bacterium]